MRALYIEAMEEYIQMNNELLSEFYDFFPAVEEEEKAVDVSTTASKETKQEVKKSDSMNDASSATQDTTKETTDDTLEKNKKRNAFIAKVKRILEKINQIISSLSPKILNRLKLMMETEKGFNKEYQKFKKIAQPKEKVRVINYTYNNKYINDIIAKLRTDFLACCNSVSKSKDELGNDRASIILSSTGTEISENFYAPYVQGDSNQPIRTASEFNKYVLEKFRGEKGDKVYDSSSLPTMEKIALGMGSVINSTNEIISSINSSYSTVKISLQSKSRTDVDDETREWYIGVVTKLSILYNDFLYLLRSFTEWKLEESLSYRAILKRFYSFS